MKKKRKNKKFQFLIWTIFGFIFLGSFMLATTTVSDNGINTSAINIIGTGTTYQVPTKSTNDTTIYVDAVSGNDVTGNGSQSFPYQTINKSISTLPDVLLNNYVIQLAQGTYREAVTLNGKLGYRYNKLTIRGNGSNPNAYRITGADAGADTTPVRILEISISDMPDVVIEGVLVDYTYIGIDIHHSKVAITDVNINQTALDGIRVYDSSYVDLPAYFNGTGYEDSTININGSDTYNNLSTGILFYGVNQVFSDLRTIININNVGTGVYNDAGVLTGDLGDIMINMKRPYTYPNSVGFFCNHPCNLHNINLNATNFDIGAGGVNSYIDLDGGTNFTNVNVSLKAVGGTFMDIDTTQFNNVTTKYLSAQGGVFDATGEASAGKNIWNIAGVSPINTTAWTLDTLYSMNTSGTKLLSVDNNGIEKFMIDSNGGVNVTGNLTLIGTSSLLTLPVITLPACGTADNNSIGRNASGTYGCNSSGVWVKIF